MTVLENQSIAVVGSGAAGLAAAWLLSRAHSVTLFEKDDRLGGHAHTALVKDLAVAQQLPIDTGFIVYNEHTYPNLTAWLDCLGVASQASDMTFAVSRNQGRFEYKGGTVLDLLAQPSNVFKPRFYRMLKDLLRFYRSFDADVELPLDLSLADLLKEGKYCSEFVDDHLLPFAAAIWSTSPNNMLNYPARAFIQFCDNHGLLQLSDRPQWRTVTGGSRSYVNAVSNAIGQENLRLSAQLVEVRRNGSGISVIDRHGDESNFDQIVLACHADQSLALLTDADSEERALLQPFKYEQNLAMLHSDRALMPRRRRAWASWNYIDQHNASEKNTVSYWMNNLQNLHSSKDYFVSLNPTVLPDQDSILHTSIYHHPQFNAETYAAQEKLWSLQGRRNTWFCGAYFGAGFHEDAIQSGLAVAEQLGRLKRPWDVAQASGRIRISATQAALAQADFA